MSITLTATQSVTTLNLTATQSGTSVNLSPVINSIGGTVTSVAINGNDGIQIDSGSPITTSGTIELGLDSDASQYPFVIDDDTMATASDTTVPTSESVKAYVDSIGGGTSLELDVTQATHGFSVGDAIRHNGTIYVKAQADSASNAGVIGVVSDVADTDNFTIQYGGILAAGVWTNGTPYFLSPSVAGSIVTEPTYNVGEVRQYIGTGTPDGLLVEIDLGDEVTTAGTGDMLASVYDPANKSEQLVGISDTSYVTEAKLAAQYKGSSVISALDVDWSSSFAYTKTLSTNSVLTFSNLYIGIKTLVITGNYTLGFPTGFTLTNGSEAYDGTKECLIEIICYDTSTPKGLVNITYSV